MWFRKVYMFIADFIRSMFTPTYILVKKYKRGNE